MVLSQWAAYYLSEFQNKEIPTVYIEKTEDKKGFVFTRGYDKLVRNKKVLLIDDVINAGSSIKKLLKTLNLVNAELVGGVGVLVPSGAMDKEIKAPIFSLINYQWESWPKEECPLCKEGVELNTDLGRGKKL